MKLNQKIGTIVIRTTNGILEIYVKDEKTIFTFVNAKDLVTYMNVRDVNEIMLSHQRILYRCLPNNLSLNILARSIIKADTSHLGLGYNEEYERIEKLKKGNKFTSYTIITSNNKKVRNLFDEYKNSKEKFNGFCNYKIDGIGNIENVEEDILVRATTTSHSIKKYLLGGSKKNNIAQTFVKKIVKQHYKNNEETLGEVGKMEYDAKRVSERFSDADKIYKTTKINEVIWSLTETKRYIERLLKGIKEIKAYINDSRLDDNYTLEEIVEAISEIYVNEKLILREDQKEIREVIGKSYINERLVKILEEDMITTILKEKKRKNFRDYEEIKFLEEMSKIKSVPENVTTKVLRIFKRYVELVESYDFFGIDNEVSPVEKDSMAIIIRNYEKYICSGILNSFGISVFYKNDVKFLTLLKNNIIKEKIGYDDIISFKFVKMNKEALDDSNLEEWKQRCLETLYTYITKDGKVYILEDNKISMVSDEKEVKALYVEYSEEYKKEHMISEIINRGNFACVEHIEEIIEPKNKKKDKKQVKKVNRYRGHILMEYQEEELIDYKEHILMTLNVVCELNEKQRDQNYKMKIVQKEEEKYFRELFEKGDIETIVDLILIAKNKKELEHKLSESKEKNREKNKDKTKENVKETENVLESTIEMEELDKDDIREIVNYLEETSEDEPKESSSDSKITQDDENIEMLNVDELVSSNEATSLDENL